MKLGIVKKSDGEAAQRSRWSGEQTTLFLNLVRKEQVSQRVAGPETFTMQLWNRLAHILSTQSEPYRQGNQLQGRWRTLKNDFYNYKQCVDKTGWGWDCNIMQNEKKN